MQREDCFFDESIECDVKKVYALIIYDIIENKSRYKFVKFLQGYGKRVQKSGFEIFVSEKKYKELLTSIPRFCSSEDSIRVYRISSENLVHKYGIDSSAIKDDLIIL